MPDLKVFSSCLNVIAKLQINRIDNWKGEALSIQRIYGGGNNALYKIECKSETLACKLCVDDGRDRATREFGALKTIQAAGYDIAPAPILLDESQSIVQYPAVLYRWADGQILQPPIKQRQLETFLDSYHKLHSIQPSGFTAFQLDAWFHWFNFNAYRKEIAELFEMYTPWLATNISDGSNLRDRLGNIIDKLSLVIADTKVDPRKNHIPLRLVRVDPNTANVIFGSKGNICWVDWEYSGWGDPALDIAELRWHAALQPLGEKALKWLRTNYKPPFNDPNFRERLRIWDHILVSRWSYLILRVLWSNHNGPDRKRLSQLEISSDQLLGRLVYYIELAENLFLGAEHVPGWQ